ncbi:unnamed protein product [Pieris brassicae]|uniref:G-protein coupled receptors family 2 profile 2 domain-containing protein n=1 Tax=Pieris brassicae TaxID=7116 RepID=A0A9P0TUS2_PIEBR|nr:unnamed protein product [Pieris brassicae]
MDLEDSQVATTLRHSTLPWMRGGHCLGDKCCWTADSNAFYIITVFVFGALLISSFLLLNVVCILFQMARRFPRHNRMIAMIKATKAALVLTPLFALHFYLIPMHLSRQNALQTTYQILSAVVVTLQGLSLAITFCFTNQDVIASFRQLFKRRQPENEVNIAMTDMSGAHVPQQVTMLQRDVPI